MDSKHRHELEQNVLAKWLITQYEDWIRPNSSWLGYALFGVLIVVAIIMVTARVNSWNRAAAWKQYYAALNSANADADLELIANSTSGTIGIQARLALAQRQLTEGCFSVFTDKPQSITVLEKAIDSFQRIQQETTDPIMLQRAGFGLGQCWEALAAARVGNDLTKAEEEYQKVADRWGDDFLGQRAKQQLALIRQPGTRTFIELAAAKVPESFGRDNFKVDFDPSDPFAPGQINFEAFDQKMETEEQKTEVEPGQKTEGNEKEPEPTSGEESENKS